jgi:hypothetical protein
VPHWIRPRKPSALLALWVGGTVFAVALALAVGTKTLTHETPSLTVPAAPPPPRYTYEGTRNVILQAIREGRLRVTLFGRQNGFYIPERNPVIPWEEDKIQQYTANVISNKVNGDLNVPNVHPGLVGRLDGKRHDDLCPATSWGVTLTIEQAVPGRISSLPDVKRRDLWYCMDKYTGAIRPVDDYARELTTGPWADQ